MNNNNFNYTDEDIEIDLTDLIKTVFKGWKLILIGAVICAVLGAAAGSLKAKSGTTDTDQAQLEAELQQDYELLKEQYDSDLRVYDMRDRTFEEYSAAVDMLNKELDAFDSLEDEDAKFSSLIRISSLQTVVNNADSMMDYYKDLERPEKLQSFEEYKAEMLSADGVGSKALAKYGVIGFVVGAFLVCCVFGFRYLFDGTIKTANEVSAYFHENVLGEADKTGFVAANVKNCLSEDIHSILVTGSTDSKKLKEVAEAIAKVTGLEQVSAMSKLNSNTDTVLAVAEHDAVVLVESLKKTKVQNLADEITLIRNAGKQLIGIAV